MLLAAFVFLVALCAAFVSGLRGTEGRLVYALDDAYIHMAVAKNLARSGVWGCTPFHFSSSTSSVLWTVLLGAVYRVIGVRDAVPLVLNVALGVGTLLVADRYLARWRAPALLRAAALLGLVLALPLPGMALMGMEHVLHALLTIAFVAASAEVLASPPPETSATRRRQTAILAGLAALLAVSRYEGLFLVGLVCVLFVLRRRLTAGVVIGASAALPVVAFGWIARSLGGYFLPNSLMLKAAGESVSTLQALLKPFGHDDIACLVNDPALPVLIAMGALAALAQWRLQRMPWRPQVLLPLLLPPLIVAHDHFVFSPTFWVYRYDAYLVAFGIFVAAVALVDLPAPRAWPSGLLPAVVLAALVAAVADVRQGLYPATEIEGMRKTYLEHYQAAQFIRAYYPGDVVLVNDLGAVTYYTDAHILDLVGLGDVEPLEIMRRTGGYTSADVRAWTDPHHPAVAIVQLGWGWIVPRVPGEWTKVAEVEVPPHNQRVGFFAIDASSAWVLRSRVQQHYGPMAALGYRLKLRRPPV